MKTLILLVRHGQTEWNRIERFRGRADVPLNEAGLEQAELTGRWIAGGWQPVAVYSSPLSRAVGTAEAIASHFSLPVIAHPGLTDIDYGEWQGFSPEEARRGWADLVQAWYQAPHTVQIPGGESLETVRQRVMAAVQELAKRHEQQTIVLVSHTVVNRLILLGILDLGNERFWRLGQDTCAINLFEAEGDDFTLMFMNSICHLRVTAQNNLDE